MSISVRSTEEKSRVTILTKDMCKSEQQPPKQRLLRAYGRRLDSCLLPVSGIFEPTHKS